MGTSKHRAGRTGGYGFAVPVALLLVSMMTTGCVPATVGFSVAYVKGNLESVVPAGSEETIAAAEATLEELDVTLTYSKHGDLKTVLIGRNPHNQRVKVNIKDRGENSSKLAIRIGTFGKSLVANDIYVRITEKLADTQEDTVEAP
jgi:hypothetical protein